MNEQLETRPVLVDVETGELLEPTVQNAARVVKAVQAMRDRLSDILADVTALLVAESQRQGTKTFHTDEGDIILAGGTSVDYDLDELRSGLEFAGCPNERIDEAIVATVTYRVNRTVLRQLSGANPKYQLAILQAAREVEKPYRASVKGT